MEYKKRCQWCGVPFIAHKLTTLYCCKACWDKAYEAKRRQNKREAQRLEVESARPVVESIGTKEFLNPTEAARLLGVSRASMYRYKDETLLSMLSFTCFSFLHLMYVYIGRIFSLSFKF